MTSMIDLVISLLRQRPYCFVPRCRTSLRPPGNQTGIGRRFECSPDTFFVSGEVSPIIFPDTKNVSGLRQAEPRTIGGVYARSHHFSLSRQHAHRLLCTAAGKTTGTISKWRNPIGHLGSSPARAG